MRSLLKPVDLLSLVFVALLAAIALFFAPAVSSRLAFISRYSLFTLVIVSIAVLDKKTGSKTFFNVLHAFLPIVIVLLVFNSLGDLIPLVSHRYYDNVLTRIDYALFGIHPTVWLERFNNALLTGLFQIAYISYYFMPISLGIVLFLRGRRREFDAMVFGVVLCFYLSYIGYLLIPAVGPRFTLNHLQTAELKTGPLTLWIQQTLDGLEQNKTDAFPSGHTAVAFVSLFYAWSCREKILVGILAPAVGALMLSTVYLRYHYVIDVIAGIALAVLTLLIAPKAYRIFAGSPGQPQG